MARFPRWPQTWPRPRSWWLMSTIRNFLPQLKAWRILRILRRTMWEQWFNGEGSCDAPIHKPCALCTGKNV